MESLMKRQGVVRTAAALAAAISAAVAFGSAALAQEVTLRMHQFLPPPPAGLDGHGLRLHRVHP